MAPRRSWVLAVMLMLASGVWWLGVLAAPILLIAQAGGKLQIYGFCLTDQRLLLVPVRYAWELGRLAEMESADRRTVVCTMYLENILHSYIDLMVGGRLTRWVLGRHYRSEARVLGWLSNQVSSRSMR
jgi:hypothetical protein